MELAQLEIFKAVAETGSIQAAAIRLHRVPSNVTTRVRQLEEELGVDLFIREKMRLRLSPAGASFLDYARRLLDLAEEAKQSLAGDVPRGLLQLGSLESTVAVRLPPALAAFHRAWPEVKLDLTTGPSGELIDQVLDGRLAGAFVDGPVPHPALSSLPLFSEELVLISAAGHDKITRARDVGGANIYAFRSNCSYRRTFERWFEADGTRPGHIYEIESYHGLVACVAVGAGLAMLPRSMLDEMPNSQAVQAHKLQAPFSKVRICLVTRANFHSPGLRRLAEMLTTPASGAATSVDRSISR